MPTYAYLQAGFNGHKCAIAVSYIDSFLNDRYILGDTFIKNYYMTFDYSTQQVGMAQNANGPVSYKQGLTWWAIMLICLGAVVVVAAIFVAVLY